MLLLLKMDQNFQHFELKKKINWVSQLNTLKALYSPEVFDFDDED